MQRVLLLVALVCGLTAVSAQNLLPYPQKVEWRKGTVKNVPVMYGTLLNMTANGSSTPPGWYSINVTDDEVQVSCTDAASRHYAEATLAQLQVRPGEYRKCSIEDWPQMEWRGAMLDVSRHFFPMEALRRHIDALAAYKINRFHLHLVDAAGWRMEIKRYPRLLEKSSYRTKESWNEWWIGKDRSYLNKGEGGYGGYYTQDELRSLVAYAQERGITIIPEIEMPGHSEEVLHAYPELSCTHKEGAADFCPGNVGTYDFLENVLREVMDVFPSEFIHVGGDEAGRADWPTCPRCQEKLREIGGKDFRDLQTHLIAHMGRFLEQQGRRLVGWDEVIDPGLHRGSTIMVWRGVEKAAEAARLGFDVVMSPGNYCYFDSYQDAPPTQPEGFGTYLPLSRVYEFDPLAGLTPDEACHIRGVQGNLWTEYVPTPEHADYMLYPRILALAEIGWGTGGRSDFRQRALAATDQLSRMGLHPFPLKNEVGQRPQFTKPVKHKALGALVTYATQPSPNYMGQGPTTLTDGQGGGWSFTDGRWQGFLNRNENSDLHSATLDLTIDLGSVQVVKSVGASFMHAPSAWVYLPEQMTVSTSTDGTTWKALAPAYTAPFFTSNMPDVKTITLKGSARARYIRLTAATSIHGGWLFTDEVEVK